MREDIVLWFMDGASADWSAFLIRLVVALALLPHGIQKFLEPENAAHFPAALFFSPKSAYLAAAIVETFASICLIFGFCTRIAAVAGLVNMLVASRVSWNKYFTSPALVFVFGFFAVLCIGPGAISLDYLFLGH